MSSVQLAVEAELAGLGASDLAQLLPSDLSSLDSWLRPTILPFITSHCPHLMVPATLNTAYSDLLPVV